MCKWLLMEVPWACSPLKFSHARHVMILIVVALCNCHWWAWLRVCGIQRLLVVRVDRLGRKTKKQSWDAWLGAMVLKMSWVLLTLAFLSRDILHCVQMLVFRECLQINHMCRCNDDLYKQNIPWTSTSKSQVSFGPKQWLYSHTPSQTLLRAAGLNKNQPLPGTSMDKIHWLNRLIAKIMHWQNTLIELTNVFVSNTKCTFTCS